MHTPKQCQPDMNNEAVIRAVLPKNGPKRLARIMDVPIETARGWMYRRLSISRTRDLALALLAVMDAEDRQRAANRERLLAMAGEHDRRAATAGGLLARGGDVVAGRAQGGAPVGEVGGAAAPGSDVLAALTERRK